jgi:hypothetical protein
MVACLSLQMRHGAQGGAYENRLNLCRNKVRLLINLKAGTEAETEADSSVICGEEPEMWELKSL